MLTVLRTPPAVGFSGNALNYSMAIAPWRPVLDEGRGLQLTVTVEVETAWAANAWQEVHRAILPPNAQGIIDFDVSMYVDAHLHYYTPDPRQRTIVECPQQSRRYRIGYTLTDSTGVVAATAYSTPAVAVKGGYAESYLPGHQALADTNMLLTTELVRSSNPLYLRPITAIQYHPHELRYMYFVARTTSTPIEADRPALVMECADPDDNVTYTFGALTYQQWRVYCIPLHLPTVVLTVPPGLRLFTLRMQGMGLENAVYRVDTRPVYEPYYLLYRNSTGGMGTLTLRGEVALEQDYSRESYSQVNWPQRFSQAILRGTLAHLRAEATQRAKGLTGFVERGRLDALLDLFTSEEVYQHIPGYGLLPVVLMSSKSKLYTNRDNAYALELEWAQATPSYHHSPLPYPVASCPALTHFSVRQASRFTLELLWSMPEPYSFIEVEIDTGDETETVVLPGNTGRQLRPFDNPVEEEPVEITVRARVVCNPYSSPPEVGAWTTLTLEVAGNLPPIAVADTVTIDSGFNTAIELPINVLDNDYDPDGDPIECIPLTEEATAEGGEITLAADGTVEYLPPSSSFTGVDSITYSIQEVAAPNLSASALLTIVVAGGSSGGGGTIIYMRIQELDVETISTETLLRTTGKRFVYFYSNPAGTSPIDLTGLGITISVTKTVTIITTQEDEPENVDITTTTPTYTAVGIRQLIHDGIFTEYRAGRAERTEIITHVLNASPQYTIL